MKAVPYTLADCFTIPRPGLACDLDESLSDTVVSWMEFSIGVFGNPESLSPRELVSKYKFSFNVPYWKDRPDYWPTMEPLLNCNDFQRKLPLITGAAEAIAKIHSSIGIACYATARPISVENGTRDWICRHGLPAVELLMRPSSVGFKDGDKAKVEAIVKLFPMVSGLIDDKEAVVKLFPSNYRGTIYHIGADTPVRTDIKVIACKDWATLALEVARARDIPITP